MVKLYFVSHVLSFETKLINRPWLNRPKKQARNRRTSPSPRSIIIIFLWSVPSCCRWILVTFSFRISSPILYRSRHKTYLPTSSYSRWVRIETESVTRRRRPLALDSNFERTKHVYVRVYISWTCFSWSYFNVSSYRVAPALIHWLVFVVLSRWPSSRLRKEASSARRLFKRETFRRSDSPGCEGSDVRADRADRAERHLRLSRQLRTTN